MTGTSHSLTLNTPSNTIVNGTIAVDSFVTDGSGSLSLAGILDINNNVTLSESIILTGATILNAGTGDITFGNTINGVS